MSACLGPIHYWLYHKIQLQESLTGALIAVLPSEKEKALTARLADTCGAVENRPLEEVIDSGNIHGWLQGQIAVAEARFAIAVTELQRDSLCQLEALKQKARQIGQRAPLADVKSPQEAYQKLNDVLLDGMPCDRVNEVLEQDDSHILWRQRTDLHKSYWEQAGGDAKNYFVLRDEWISGMLEGSGLVFERSGEQFSIRGRRKGNERY